jgi:hypothetical protein
MARKADWSSDEARNHVGLHRDATSTFPDRSFRREIDGEGEDEKWLVIVRRVLS